MSLNLDLSTAQEPNSVLPAGRYACIVEDAKVKTTKTGGEMISAQFKVLDGTFKGRVVFSNYNIKNANALAVQIGLGELRAMMRAGGHPNPNRLESTTELVGLKLTVVTKVESDPQYGENTRVKGYAPFVATAADVATQAATPNANPFA